ncbi:hypothetical protein ASPZODRAFT_1031809 [Penicilliopsis zonata CBS 506.65]|uniref:Uncharacterized protein n=1 Tax=Penicilliopsis zonata CBS 506.65 TaxID=1073090 RepID=A0A1L9SRQ5_9EURO|nr:hypothetical protein ASPZODRAFT_1031809 [Penicilliopsis zonata CBS 506.65]OJJ49804.1 hypothetical protein ASPZODRAFT_1031809 [Penicilliopsis zonata CBS 506.65]
MPNAPSSQEDGSKIGFRFCQNLEKSPTSNCSIFAHIHSTVSPWKWLDDMAIQNLRHRYRLERLYDSRSILCRAQSNYWFDRLWEFIPKRSWVPTPAYSAKMQGTKAQGSYEIKSLDNQGDSQTVEFEPCRETLRVHLEKVPNSVQHPQDDGSLIDKGANNNIHLAQIILVIVMLGAVVLGLLVFISRRQQRLASFSHEQDEPHYKELVGIYGPQESSRPQMVRLQGVIADRGCRDGTGTGGRNPLHFKGFSESEAMATLLEQSSNKIPGLAKHTYRGLLLSLVRLSPVRLNEKNPVKVQGELVRIPVLPRAPNATVREPLSRIKPHRTHSAHGYFREGRMDRTPRFQSHTEIEKGWNNTPESGCDVIRR